MRLCSGTTEQAPTAEVATEMVINTRSPVLLKMISGLTFQAVLPGHAHISEPQKHL